MMRHRHTITSRDHVPRVSPFIKSKSRMTNVERPERGVELRPTRRNFPMLAMDGTSESFDFSFLSSEDVLSYREFRSRFNCRFSFHDIFPRSKWKVARNTRRRICSNACQWVCRAAVKLRHIGEDSLPSRRRREETIVRVDERKEARCDYSHAPPRGLPHRDSRQ